MILEEARGVVDSDGEYNDSALAMMVVIHHAIPEGWHFLQSTVQSTLFYYAKLTGGFCCLRLLQTEYICLIVLGSLYPDISVCLNVLSRLHWKVYYHFEIEREGGGRTREI